jgi:hypothetical protein
MIRWARRPAVSLSWKGLTFVRGEVRAARHLRQHMVASPLTNYAPLMAGLLAPFRGDRILAEEKRCQLDRLYQRITDDLDALVREVGLKIAA